MGQAADELRADIERTREDMASTVDAIGERLSPKLQAERQIDRLREKGLDPQRAVLIAGAVLVLFLFLRRGRGRRDG
ncbi:MAG TPA: DUF3618 domain-containing protein [Acidimicrobiia bacterium]|nr:DUF3618 domain-containing protein [Acidimicrobiia bacterium]